MIPPSRLVPERDPRSQRRRRPRSRNRARRILERSLVLVIVGSGTVALVSGAWSYVAGEGFGSASVALAVPSGCADFSQVDAHALPHTEPPTATCTADVLDFGIPGGAPGATGDAGDAGPQGETGATGSPGADGTSVSVTPEPAGVNCAEGGSRFDGVGTSYACTGEPGETGATGAQGAAGDDGTSVAVTPEPAGVNCAEGGARFDGVGVGYACDGATGAQGPAGVAGADGADGVSGFARVEAAASCSGVNGAFCEAVATCSAGKVALGGGFRVNAAQVRVHTAAPTLPGLFEVRVSTLVAQATYTLTVWATCAAVGP